MCCFLIIVNCFINQSSQTDEKHPNCYQWCYCISKVSPDKDFKADWGFRMCCSSSSEESQTSNIVDTGQQRKLNAAVERHIKFIYSEVGRRPAVPFAQTWQKPSRFWYIYLLSRECWPKVILMEELQPTGQTPKMEMRPTDLFMQKNRNCCAENDCSALDWWVK